MTTAPDVAAREPAPGSASFVLRALAEAAGPDAGGALFVTNAVVRNHTLGTREVTERELLVAVAG